jgi:ribonuclease BN (tRNA processing enzyme)
MPPKPATVGDWSVEAFSTPSSDSTTSLFVHFDNKRYAFNVPEGFCRNAASTSLSLSKTDSVFLSKIHSDAIGGLAGNFVLLFSRGITVF